METVAQLANDKVSQSKDFAKESSKSKTAQKKSGSGQVKKRVGILLAVIIFAVSYFIPGSESLSHQGCMAVGTLLACVALWFCGTFPQGVTSLLGIILLTMFGIVPSLSDALSGFTSSTTWFILCVFCMTAIMQTGTLGVRLTLRLISWAGANSKKLVFAFMLGTAVASFFMTDTGAVVLGMSMVLPLLNAVGAKPGSSNLGKCLMLGVAFSGVLGGFAMPCGHSLNVLGMGIMESTVGESVSFLGWMIVGIPIFAIMLPTTCFLLTKAFPPEDISSKHAEIESTVTSCGPWTAHDKKALFIVVLLPVLWVASNWITILNTTIVAMLGVILMFLPGINLMSWKQFQDIAGWNVFLFFGGIMCLGNAVSSTGGTDFIASLLLNSGILNIPPFLALLIVGYALYLIHTFCPVAPALCMLFLPPLLTWAQTVGIPTVIPVFVMASITAGSFLVPLNPTIVVTYEQGYYKFGEVAKGGWLAAILFVFVTVCWSYFICDVLGVVQSFAI